jgi:MFS family permease
MMELMGAALSVFADAVGTLAAVFALLFIRKPEPKPDQSSTGGEHNFFAEMKEGIRVITGNKLLWTQAGCTGTSNLGTNIFGVAVLLYAYRTLGISKGLIGIAFTIGSAGFLVGVLISSYVTEKLGVGKAVALSIAGSFGLLLVLLANGNFSVIILGLAYFVAFLGVATYNINQVSLRQIITPNRLQGRMNATMRTIVWGTIPAGSLLGGIFVTSFGIVPTLIIGTLIAGFACLWIVLGPAFKLKKQPEPVND